MSLEKSETSSEPASSEPASSEEDQLLGSISRLRTEIDRIESTTGPSQRTHCIRDEIKRLGNRLANCKIKAREQGDQGARLNPEIQQQ